MKFNELLEDYGQSNVGYQNWIKLCRKACPDCQVHGDQYHAQMVWWNDKDNPVVGEWDGKKGTVYPVKVAAEPVTS